MLGMSNKAQRLIVRRGPNCSSMARTLKQMDMSVGECGNVLLWQLVFQNERRQSFLFMVQQKDW